MQRPIGRRGNCNKIDPKGKGVHTRCLRCKTYTANNGRICTSCLNRSLPLTGNK